MMKILNLRLQTSLAIALIVGLCWSRVGKAELPYLVQREPESIRTAWRDIEVLIIENAALPEPLPDPYWARADLWALVGNHEEALEDYLHAAQLFRKSRPNPAEKSRVLERLSESLDHLVHKPRPEYPIEAGTAFGYGLGHFRQSRYEKALEYFKEATRLLPTDPVYRAYRGLTLKQLDKAADAERQIAIAASILRAPGRYDNREEWRSFYRRLEPVQGPLRQWLSEYMHRPGIENRTLRAVAETQLRRP